MRKPSLATALAGLSLFISLGGTSLAASHYLITSKSQIAPKVRRALRGHRGPQGLRGFTGAQGVVGPHGTPGQDGASNTFDTIKYYYRVGAPQVLSTDRPELTTTERCDGSDKIINGGYSGQGEIVTRDASFGDPSEWEVTAHVDPSATSGSVSVWLVCAVQGT